MIYFGKGEFISVLYPSSKNLVPNITVPIQEKADVYLLAEILMFLFHFTVVMRLSHIFLTTPKCFYSTSDVFGAY